MMRASIGILADVVAISLFIATGLTLLTLLVLP
jgi:hypothetical protein